MAEETVNNRKRAEQKYVVVISHEDGQVQVIGTVAGGPLTRDAAWLMERWYRENHPHLQATATKIAPTPEGVR